MLSQEKFKEILQFVMVFLSENKDEEKAIVAKSLQDKTIASLYSKQNIAEIEMLYSKLKSM